MNKREWAIGAGVIVLVAASLGAVLHGMGLQRDARPVTTLRSFVLQGREHVAAVQADRLHLLDAQGRRLAMQPLSQLGLSEEPTDMDWVADAAGQWQAWFFEDTTPRIVRCRLDAAALRLVGCGQVLAGPALKANPRSRAVHLAVDLARERVFVADANGHQVRAHGFDGRLLATTAPGLLYYPNRLRLTPAGQLVVADNDHHRLVWLDAAGEVPALARTASLPVTAHPAARGDRVRAADFAIAAGADGTPSALWVLAVAQGQKNGDVLLYGPGLVARGRADLGGWDDPLLVDTFGGGALLADVRGVSLYRVGEDGRFLGDFGQGDFARELQAMRAHAVAAGRWTVAGWSGLAATIVIGLLLGWRFGERPGTREAGAAFARLADVPADAAVGPVELAPLPWYQAHLRAIVVLVPAMAIGVPGALLLAMHASRGTAGGMLRGWPSGVLVALLLVLLAVAIWRTWATMPRSLVVEGGRLRVRSRARDLASASLAQLTASPHALLVEGLVVPYSQAVGFGRPARWIYEQDAFSRYVLAHVPAPGRVTDARLQLAALARGHGWVRLLPLLLVAGWFGWQLWQRYC